MSSEGRVTPNADKKKKGSKEGHSAYVFMHVPYTATLINQHNNVKWINVKIIGDTEKFSLISIEHHFNKGIYLDPRQSNEAVRMEYYQKQH